MTQAAMLKTANPELLGEIYAGPGPQFQDPGTSTSDGSIGLPAGMSARLVRSICAMRRDRQEHFPAAVGSEPCWNILLQLYSAHLDQHRMTISQLTRRTGVPATTVLRSIQALKNAGFTARSDDKFDRRRVFVELSAAGVAAMNRYFIKCGARAAFL